MEKIITDKQEAAYLLKENGYNAAVENNIVMVTYHDDKSPMDKIRKLLRENGYHASFGVQKKKEAE